MLITSMGRRPLWRWMKIHKTFMWRNVGGRTPSLLSWVNLTVFLLASLANCIPTHTFTPINSTVTRVYDVSKTLVGLNTLVFPISHPLLAFLANWVLDRYGLRIGVTIILVYRIAPELSWFWSAFGLDASFSRVLASSWSGQSLPVSVTYSLSIRHRSWPTSGSNPQWLLSLQV